MPAIAGGLMVCVDWLVMEMTCLRLGIAYTANGEHKTIARIAPLPKPLAREALKKGCHYVDRLWPEELRYDPQVPQVA